LGVEMTRTECLEIFNTVLADTAKSEGIELHSDAIKTAQEVFLRTMHKKGFPGVPTIKEAAKVYVQKLLECKDKNAGTN
jgi:hypothetical protein